MKKCLIIFIVLGLIITLSSCGQAIEETRSIKGLQITSTTTQSSGGLFVMGIGVYSSSENTETYYYTYVMGKEGYKLQQIPSGNLEIVETDSVEPCMKGCFYWHGGVDKFQNYIAYVPVGTVFAEYNTQPPKDGE